MCRKLMPRRCCNVRDIATFFHQRQSVSFDLPECQIPYTVVPNLVRRASIENVVHRRLYQRHGGLYVSPVNAFCFGAGCTDWARRPCPDHRRLFLLWITTARNAHVFHARGRRKRVMGEGERKGEREKERGRESTASDTGVVRDCLDEMKSSRSVRLGRCACAAGDTAEHKL